jgi:hypothetical protein
MQEPMEKRRDGGETERTRTGRRRWICRRRSSRSCSTPPGGHLCAQTAFRQSSEILALEVQKEKERGVHPDSPTPPKGISFTDNVESEGVSVHGNGETWNLRESWSSVSLMQTFPLVVFSSTIKSSAGCEADGIMKKMHELTFLLSRLIRGEKIQDERMIAEEHGS